MNYDIATEVTKDCQNARTLLESFTPRPLDSELVVYPNQVGGHGAFGSKCGILRNKTPGVVYKPVQRFPKGLREVELYERVFAPDCNDEIILELRQFIPAYQGVFYEPKSNVYFFCMSDLLSSLVHPSICDIKMGQVTYTPDSPPSKVHSERSKYKWQEELGFSLTGLRLCDSTTDEAVYLDRNYGRSLNPVSVYDSGIRLFLGRDLTRARRLATLFASRLRQLADWFEKQHRFAFYASSLLLAFGNPGATSVDEANPRDSPADESIVARLIDFTRWCELSGQRDDNLLYGLYKLIELFERAATETTQPPAIPTGHVFVHG